METAAEEVPRQFEKIEVLFELDDGTFYWCPATVLDTTKATRAGTVKGTATVGFAARQKMKTSVEFIHFLVKRLETCEEGETQSCTSAEATNADAGDAGKRIGDLNWRRGRPRLERVLDRPRTHKRDTSMRTSEGDRRSPHRRAGCSVVIRMAHPRPGLI